MLGVSKVLSMFILQLVYLSFLMDINGGKYITVQSNAD